MALPKRDIEKQLFIEDEYFEFSRTAEERWEFTPVGDGSRLGRIRMMAGGTDDHATIIGNIAAALHGALTPRGCRTYSSDMRIHAGSGKNTFPDVAVVCGQREYHRARADTLLNPILIVEVLSASTAAYDLGEKFEHYQTIPTLADYRLMFQEQTRVLLCSRRADTHWDLQIVAGLERSVYLPSVDVTLALADVYALIEFVNATKDATED